MREIWLDSKFILQTRESVESGKKSFEYKPFESTSLDSTLT